MLRSILISIVFCFGIQANAFIGLDLKNNIDFFEKHSKAQAVGTLALPWVVGEQANYSLKMSILTGKVNMEVKSDTGNGFWVHQNMEVAGQKNLVEMLFDKETGEVLELIVNGKKEDIPEQGDAEVIEQREEEVTVPAGSYDCIYLKIRSDGQDSEMWVNPIDVPIFGLLKQIAPTQLGPSTLELKDFKDL